MVTEVILYYVKEGVEVPEASISSVDMYLLQATEGVCVSAEPVFSKSVPLLLFLSPSSSLSHFHTLPVCTCMRR